MPTDALEGTAGQAAMPYRATAMACAVACGLAPAYTIRWHLGFYPSTLLEDAIAVCLVVFAVDYLSGGRQPVRWRGPFLLPALVFLLAGVIAVASAPNRVAALGLFRAYLVEPIAFAFVLANVIRTPARALLLLVGFWAGATAAGLANSAVVGAALANHTYDVAQSPPVVIYMTANAVALFVVPLFALAGSLALHGRGRERLAGGIFSLIGGVVTFLSFSRGGYLALAAVVLGLAISHRRRLALLGLALLGAGMLSLVPPIRTRVLIETHNVYGNTVASRIDLWTATAHLLRARPLLGAGLAGFPTRIVPYFSHLHTQANFIDPHNIVLNFWVETGLLGLLAFGWAIGAAMRVGWRGWRRPAHWWRQYHLGVLLALIALVVHGLVDVPYFKNDLSLEFWAILGIAWAGLLWPEPRGDGESARLGSQPPLGVELPAAMP